VKPHDQPEELHPKKFEKFQSPPLSPALIGLPLPTLKQDGELVKMSPKQDVAAAASSNRNFVQHLAETITNTAYTEYPGTYPGEDHSWNAKTFRDNLKIEFHESKPYDCTFSMVGIPPAIANALRRIVVAETPTLAIETVAIDNNTSVIQDEVLASRLGLIPLKVSDEGREFMRYRKGKNDENPETMSSEDTVVMKLQVECKWAPNGKAAAEKGERDPHVLFEHAHGKVVLVKPNHADFNLQYTLATWYGSHCLDKPKGLLAQ
jgi:hypothetical protein